MTLKQFNTLRSIVAFLVAMVVALSVLRENFFWPVVTVAVAVLVMLFLRRRVKEVIADERDLAVGGTAAMWSIKIFSIAAIIILFVFYAQGKENTAFRTMAETLAYTTCALMLLYSSIFTFLRRRGTK